MLTLAQSYLAPLTGSGPRLDNLHALRLNGVQDVLVQVRPVPEPSTLISLAGGGLVVLLAHRRRRRVGAGQATV
jgi:hypothetical protein